jgi:hypothetical protein
MIALKHITIIIPEHRKASAMILPKLSTIPPISIGLAGSCSEMAEIFRRR